MIIVTFLVSLISNPATSAKPSRYRVCGSRYSADIEFLQKKYEEIRKLKWLESGLV